MTCDERRTVAYLAGDLGADERASFERHLMSCENCWAAVRDDRTGRELAEQLRELAPAGLRDRVRATVELAAQPPKARHHFRTRAVAAAAVVVVLAGGGAYLGSHRGGDPAVVSDVLALAAGRSDVAAGMHRYGGQTVDLSMSHMHGEPVVVAKSSGAFPMPAHGMPLGQAHGEPWVAQRHGMTLLCLDKPSHLLLGGRMPAADLLALARSMGYSP